MKKIGVLTFHNYDNYGAILQSYALQKKLKELEAEPEIIDYRCEYICNPFRIINLKKKGFFNYIYGIAGNICYIPRRKKCNKFRRHMKYSPRVTKDNIKSLGDKYDVYLAGSDQIWDYKLTNFDQTYFLNFVNEEKKKVSYAASMENIPPNEVGTSYAELLKTFDNVLVRENYVADIIEELLGKRPECVCDPTILLTAEEWKSILKKPKNNDKYILVYQLGINKEIVRFVKRLQRKTGYRVIYIPFPLLGILRCDINLTIGPNEWLGLFNHSEYVISDSFHGIVFAILFNKKFFGMINGHHINRRMEQLLAKVNLLHRTIDNVSDYQLTEDIDFTYANKQIEQMREDSMRLLKKIIE